MRIDHYEPGEIVIRKHEIGRELFIVKNGEVEVFQPAEDGNAETLVATLRRGEVFGEKALLDDTRAALACGQRRPSRCWSCPAPISPKWSASSPSSTNISTRLMKERYPEHLPAMVTLAEKIALPVPQPGRGRTTVGVRRS